jgi:predicted transcriptional regulator
MAVDLEVLNALSQAVLENAQTESLEKVLAAWLNAMSEREINQDDTKRYIEAAKHAIQIDTKG